MARIQPLKVPASNTKPATEITTANPGSHTGLPGFAVNAAQATTDD